MNPYSIAVEVQSFYLAEQSDPDNRRYVFAYKVTLRNAGNVSAKLVSRHWVISDTNGRVQEVRGDGVVGEQPHLSPGESYHYTSGTVIETPMGSMHGSYQMVADDGVHFEAEIAPFSLSGPGTLH